MFVPPAAARPQLRRGPRKSKQKVTRLDRAQSGVRQEKRAAPIVDQHVIAAGRQRQVIEARPSRTRRSDRTASTAGLVAHHDIGAIVVGEFRACFRRGSRTTHRLPHRRTWSSAPAPPKMMSLPSLPESTSSPPMPRIRSLSPPARQVVRGRGYRRSCCWLAGSPPLIWKPLVPSRSDRSSSAAKPPAWPNTT